MTKTTEFLIANLGGLLGGLYVNKGKEKEKIGVDLSFFIVWVLISIATIAFFAFLVSQSNLVSLKGMNETEKFWIGAKWTTISMVVLFYIIQSTKWIAGNTNTYKFKEDGSSYLMKNVPFISIHSYNEVYDLYSKNDRRKKKEKTLKVERELQEDINKLINKTK